MKDNVKMVQGPPSVDVDASVQVDVVGVDFDV